MCFVFHGSCLLKGDDEGEEAKTLLLSRTWAFSEQDLGEAMAGSREPYWPTPAGVPTAEASPARSRPAPGTGHWPKIRQRLDPRGVRGHVFVLCPPATNKLSCTPLALPGLCALSINHANSYLAYPGSVTSGEIALYDGNTLVSAELARVDTGRAWKQTAPQQSQRGLWGG